MKNGIVTFLLVLSLGATSAALGQVNDEIELTRAIIQTQRQAIVANAMELSDAESKVFWPVFHEYRSELNKIGDRLVNLIMEYAEDYGSLSEDKASWMVDEFLAIEKAKLKVRSKFVKRFGKVLPPKKVARFFQIENKLDAIVNFDLAENVPLIE